ncbi:type II toxin-antitoxin system RelE family toxin [Streptomyces nondiastaticus]|uniref:Type II toxin-antitoxin system RelE/ParE family toxin n=1 Tax=Streptomyces nondiastaticus TaxID=3154512 RepID=A0ABW6UAE2_9ACTN
MIGAKACASAVRELADTPCPEAAVPFGGSGYYRLSVGTWRVLYRVDEDTVVIMLVGRVP